MPNRLYVVMTLFKPWCGLLSGEVKYHCLMNTRGYNDITFNEAYIIPHYGGFRKTVASTPSSPFFSRLRLYALVVQFPPTSLPVGMRY